MAHGNAISSGAQASLTVTLSGAVAVGDLVVHGLFYGDDATTASVNDATLGAGKDSLGNVYSTLGPLDFTSDGDFLYVFYSVITVAGTPAIRFLASGGTHNFKDAWSTKTPTNVFTLDQAITSHYNSTPGGTLTAGNQTPTGSLGYAFNVYAATASLNAFTAGGTPVFTERDETSDGFVVFQDFAYSSNANITGAASTNQTVENGGILVLFKDASGGASADVLIRYGNVAQTQGSGLLTAAFLSTAVATLGGGAYFLRRRQWDETVTWEDL